MTWLANRDTMEKHVKTRYTSAIIRVLLFTDVPYFWPPPNHHKNYANKADMSTLRRTSYLDEPLPYPGMEFVCTSCEALLKVTYPPGVMDTLIAKGKTFQKVKVEFGPMREVKTRPNTQDSAPPTQKSAPSPVPKEARPAPPPTPTPKAPELNTALLSMPSPTIPDAAPIERPPSGPSTRHPNSSSPKNEVWGWLNVQVLPSMDLWPSWP